MKTVVYTVLGALTPVLAGLYVWGSIALACSLVDNVDAQACISVGLVFLPPLGALVGYEMSKAE